MFSSYILKLNSISKDTEDIKKVNNILKGKQITQTKQIQKDNKKQTFG